MLRYSGMMWIGSGLIGCWWKWEAFHHLYSSGSNTQCPPNPQERQNNPLISLPFSLLGKWGYVTTSLVSMHGGHSRTCNFFSRAFWLKSDLLWRAKNICLCLITGAFIAYTKDDEDNVCSGGFTVSMKAYPNETSVNRLQILHQQTIWHQAVQTYFTVS